MKFLAFLRTTAIGGILFLLPLVVIGTLLGSIYNVVIQVYEPLKKFLPVHSAIGILLLFLLAVAIVVLLCFFCGLITKRALARKFTQTVEKQLITVFPKYAIYKDLLAGNLGGDENVPSLTPVTVKLIDQTRLAFEADRLPDGRVLVYLPGAPDTWNGEVVVVDPEQVAAVDVPFSEYLGIFEKLGRECGPFVKPPANGTAVVSSATE